MIHKKKAFTLAEALIILLIVSLIAAALIPVLTRKHREVALHGKWICTINDRGKYVVKTVYNGVDSGFKQLSTSSCTFSPPANAYNFTVKAVGGGGGGAGGMQGTEDIIYDSSRDGNDFGQSIKRAGTYLMVAIGGGGAGGSMGCGEARNYLPSLSYKSYGGLNNPDPYGNRHGSVDRALHGFDYTKLYKNDSEEVFNYIHNADNFKNRNLCFAESDTSTKKWSFMDTSSGDQKINTSVCWNLPGHGGYRAEGENGKQGKAVIKTLPAGQSIYARVGKGGAGQSDGYTYMYTYTNGSSQYTKVEIGKDGTKGGQSVIDYGIGTPLISDGGTPGYSRILRYVTYDVEVENCANYEKITQTPYNYYCSSYTSQSACNSGYKCYATTKEINVPDPDWVAPEDNPDAVHPTVKQTVFDKCHSQTYPVSSAAVDESTCKKVKREDYFSVPACISTSIISTADLTKADAPQLNDPISTDSEGIKRGGAGSGGYGSGNLSTNYIKSDDDDDSSNPTIRYSFVGDDGSDGQALIARISYTGGSGGQAGAYINTMFKKLPRVTITIGRGGAPSKGGSNANGEPGGTTKFGTLFTALGGKGGQANAITTDAKLIAGGKYAMLGGNGTASPMEPLANKAKIVPAGGYASGNSGINGNSILTPSWKSLNNIKSLLGLSFTLLQSVGGNDLEMTYGAGGGGGAGTSTGAGNGGAGAPGVVIIEW